MPDISINGIQYDLCGKRGDSYSDRDLLLPCLYQSTNQILTLLTSDSTSTENPFSRNRLHTFLIMRV